MADVPAFSLPAADTLKTTASGLQYEVMIEGSGSAPSASDTVTVHYAGWLTDGTPFDSSYGRGQPTSFPLNRVISGWTEGLQLMKAGGTTKFIIPPDLGYGSRGAPPVIGPNATLVFQVELLKVG
jgi:FKBP-type peptidyl-prolyl cis-trans isomerase